MKGDENLISVDDWNAIVREDKVKEVTGKYGFGNSTDIGVGY